MTTGKERVYFNNKPDSATADQELPLGVALTIAIPTGVLPEVLC